MSVTREFDEAFYAALARVAELDEADSRRVREDGIARAQAARHIVEVATPLFAAAFTRLQAEGFNARRLPTANKGLFKATTEPVIATGEESMSWGQRAKSFGPFTDLGNLITANGRFFIHPEVDVEPRVDDTVPVFHQLVPPSYAQPSPYVKGRVRWFRLEDVVEIQARAISFAVRVVPSLSQVAANQLGRGYLVDESTGAVHLVWARIDLPELDVVAGVTDQLEPLVPGVAFHGYRLESLEDYVARLVARKIVLSGRGGRQ
ncbi:hypothetical protein [Gordonia sp. NPDC058843]|uniref:hypothetical protein n=1 Tax=Gordonia sp. NPDC058843 TaxID=3346648 RepID=UPI0036A44C6A